MDLSRSKVAFRRPLKFARACQDPGPSLLCVNMISRSGKYKMTEPLIKAVSPFVWLRYIAIHAKKEKGLSRIDLNGVAHHLAEAWKSRVISQIGETKIKVLRMDEAPLAEDQHAEAEALLVLSGFMNLIVEDEGIVPVRAGEVYIVPAHKRHQVGPGSSGTLVIIARD